MHLHQPRWHKQVRTLIHWEADGVTPVGNSLQKAYEAVSKRDRSMQTKQNAEFFNLPSEMQGWTQVPAGPVREVLTASLQPHNDGLARAVENAAQEVGLSGSAFLHVFENQSSYLAVSIVELADEQTVAEYFLQAKEAFDPGACEPSVWSDWRWYLNQCDMTLLVGEQRDNFAERLQAVARLMRWADVNAEAFAEQLKEDAELIDA